jgi:hypothetical protein
MAMRLSLGATSHLIRGIGLNCAGVGLKCNGRMVGGLFKNIPKSKKKVLPFSSIFLSRLLWIVTIL